MRIWKDIRQSKNSVKHYLIEWIWGVAIVIVLALLLFIVLN